LNILSDDPYRDRRGEKKTGHCHEQNPTQCNYQREYSIKVFIHILLGIMLYAYFIDKTPIMLT